MGPETVYALFLMSRCFILRIIWEQQLQLVFGILETLRGVIAVSYFEGRRNAGSARSYGSYG